MKKTLLFLTALLLGGACLLAQDSTDTTGVGPGGSFPVTWPDVFDLIDLVIVWALSIAVGRWRQVLQAISALLPFLEDFVNFQDKRAVLNIAKAREARLMKRAKPNDLIVQTVAEDATSVGPKGANLGGAASIIILFLLLPLGLFSQADPGYYDPPFEPELMPGEYPTLAADGLKFFFTDHVGNRQEINDGDTVYFEPSHSPPLEVVNDPINKVWNRWPLISQDTGALWYEFRKYSGDYHDHGFIKGDTSSSFGGRFPQYWEGLYYGLQLKSPAVGRFIRFYIKTNETLAIYTDTTEITVPVDSIVFDTVEQFVTVPIDSIVFDTVEHIVNVPKDSFIFVTVPRDSIVFDTVERIVTIPVDSIVFDTVEQFVTIPVDSVVYDTIVEVVLSVKSADLQFLADKIDGLPNEIPISQIASATADSVVLKLPRSPEDRTAEKDRAILTELKSSGLAAFELAAKYHKGSTIKLGDFDVTTCDFLDWAGRNSGQDLDCFQITETTIFKIALDVAAKIPVSTEPRD